jgi:ABC-type glycerol-3-phosphate transport system substrate-binding protein
VLRNTVLRNRAHRNRAHRNNRARRIPVRPAVAAGAALLLAGGLAAGCSSSGSTGSGLVIKAVLPPTSGNINAAANAGLKKLTAEYEKAHPKVTVQWLPENSASITTANAAVEAQASGGSAPDLVWEQYGPVTSGALPQGLLQNIKPWLEKPNPYVPGNTSWLSLFSKSTVPYMTSPNGDIDIILGSDVETGSRPHRPPGRRSWLTWPS